VAERTYPHPVTAPLEPPPQPAAVPSAFAPLRAEVELGRTVAARPDLVLHDVPAPTRLAPYAVAVAAQVLRDGEETASGRFVVLHDPQGQEGWHGCTRVVAFVSADVEAEMAADGALAEVGWQWLTEALTERGARHTAAAGTVTRTTSSRFGQLTDPSEDSEVEVRASWTALADADGRHDLDRHMQAWCDLLCSTAGLPPPGVSTLRPR